jgi:prepilin-type N-terminal cleavage/methylation domain-containing protein
VRGRTSAYWTNPRRERGFSLIEILIVVLIMGFVLGMTGSLLGGFMNMFDTNENQNVARQRAQDVLTLLSVPLQNAGLGLCATSEDLDDGIERIFDGIGSGGSGTDIVFGAHGSAKRKRYIEIVNSSTTSDPSEHWHENATSGDMIRVIYGLPTGVNILGADESSSHSGEFDLFDKYSKYKSPSDTGEVVFYIDKTAYPDFEYSSPSDSTILKPWRLHVGDGNTINFCFTFPGMDMMPIKATAVVPATGTDPLKLTGTMKSPLYTASPDFVTQNVIRPNSDLILLRDICAFVDAYKYFGMVEQNGTAGPEDWENIGVRSADYGFRVEGIAGIWFEQDINWRYVTVTVLAEGDVMDERMDGARASLAAKWAPRGVSLVNGVYYEEMSRTFRTRNLQPTY